MAYIAKNLIQAGGEEAKTSRTTNGNRAPALWMYGTVDGNTTVRGLGYFNDAKDYLRPGDLIFCITYSTAAFETTTATVNGAQMMVVLTNDGTNVDLSNGLSISLTNT